MSFLQAANATTNASSYTFSAQNLGTAAADRHIVVAITSSRTTSQTISSVTVAGVSATIVAQVTGGAVDDLPVAGIAIAAVPTGTSGDIVVTFSGTMSRCSIEAYRLTGLNSITPVDTGTSTAAAPTTDLDMVSGGAAIGCAGIGNATGTSIAWTNLTEDHDDLNENLLHGSASTTPGATSTVTVTATFTSDGHNTAGAFASWAPASGATTRSRVLGGGVCGLLGA